MVVLLWNFISILLFNCHHASLVRSDEAVPSGFKGTAIIGTADLETGCRAYCGRTRRYVGRDIQGCS